MIKTQWQDELLGNWVGNIFGWKPAKRKQYITELNSCNEQEMIDKMYNDLKHDVQGVPFTVSMISAGVFGTGRMAIDLGKV